MPRREQRVGKAQCALFGSERYRDDRRRPLSAREGRARASRRTDARRWHAARARRSSARRASSSAMRAANAIAAGSAVSKRNARASLTSSSTTGAGPAMKPPCAPSAFDSVPSTTMRGSSRSRREPRALRSHDAERVRFVEQAACRRRPSPASSSPAISGVAFHAEDRLAHDARRLIARGRQRGMLVDRVRHRRETDPVDERGVVEAIRRDGVDAAREHRNRADCRVIARREQQRAFAAQPARELLL